MLKKRACSNHSDHQSSLYAARIIEGPVQHNFRLHKKTNYSRGHFLKLRAASWVLSHMKGYQFDTHKFAQFAFSYALLIMINDTM